MIIMVIYNMAEKNKVKEIKNFNKIDKITRVITITTSVILGSIFLAACVYMLSLINEEQKANNNSNNTVQNMNLVNM